jgi:hypothetical protein
MFPSLSCFTHRLTLLAPMQTYPYSCWSCASISEGRNLLFNKTTGLWTVMQRPVLANHFHAVKNDHMKGAGMQFSLWREMKDGTISLTLTIPDLRQFKVAELRIYEILNRRRKIWHNNIFETRTEFFLVEMKRQWEDYGGRILLGNCTDGSAVMLRQTRFQCVGIWI